MLLSAVIHLQALENGSLPVDMGPALRAEFLKWVGEADPKQGDDLHDGNDLRPYTISDLKGTFRAQRGFHLVQSGQSAWFRITSLSDSLTTLLLDSVFSKIGGRTFSLDRANFQVQKVSDEAHPWAGKSSFEALVDRYIKAELKPSDTMEVEFASPTTFHSNTVHVPLPVPETVFGSWLDRWNAFSNARLPRDSGDMAQAGLVLSRYKLETQVVHYKEASWIGFTGNCRFRVVSKDEYWVRLCSLLSSYAFYCGTGAKTSFGLGQTKGTHELAWKNP